VITCADCQQSNPDGAHFCNGCGAELNPPPTAREERRIVTALFADMAGFTARAEQLDPEDVRAILDRYYSRLRTEIESFGGIVEKFIGDAVVAFFGAPVAHGDDPERAVRAGLAVCNAVAQMNAEDAQLELEVRVAVNTGEAMVPLRRSDLQEGMVAGDVVNTASRMQAAAPTNSVLVGEDTYRATRGLIEYRELEPLRVKGKREPVRAWLVLRVKREPGERPVSDVPMLGRSGELTALHQIFESVRGDQRPHLVTVFGDAGVGKTRLAAEFTAQLSAEEARVIRGRSLPYGASTPYGPFSQHVKLFSGIFASDDLAVARTKLRTALSELPALADSEQTISHLELLIGLDSSAEVADRQTLFRAARRFAEALARQHPVVLVFEDVHWADSGTLDLLELLASRVRDVPMMLLALARPHLLHERPSWGGGLPGYTALSLEALSREDARELAVQLLRRRTADADSVRQIEAAEGNPLFIEELIAAAVERPSSAGQQLPTTIRELLLARLDVLPAEERVVLLDAAVVGKTFWRGALEPMGPDQEALDEALDALEARDLIRHEPRSWIEGQEQFNFKHALIRDVAYATVPRARRRELHGIVARFLEAVTRGAGATATALAGHWREAGEDELALEYLLLAAEQAGRGWAKDEAAALYGQAAELCRSPERRRELVAKQALALVAFQHVLDARLHAGRAATDEADAPSAS
jgi:class 3 adenylate cyclase